MDGHDPEAVRRAFNRDPTTRPRVVLLRTHKGHGVSSMRDRMESHYLPLTEQQYAEAVAEIQDALQR